jgi:hypothetical protein
MTPEEVTKYWYPARENIGRRLFKCEIGIIHYYSAARYIASALGLEYPFPNHFTELKLTPEMKRILVLLAVPHFLAVTKILEIRRSQDAA